MKEGLSEKLRTELKSHIESALDDDELIESLVESVMDEIGTKEPSDVFEDSDLESWAEANGFERKEE